MEIAPPLLLEVQDLSVAFAKTLAVDRISFRVEEGETLGLVGESGCGKSTTALALMGLLRDASLEGRACLDGVDLIGLDEDRMRAIRGSRMGMVFQDPATALHPMLRVGQQVAEVLDAHLSLSRVELKARTVDLFRKVGIAAPEQRIRAFPHELSGGMCQRVVIAMAIACGPRLLLADEPTTALDVTVQAQILDLLRDIASQSKAGMVLITHDLGVVAGMADRVAVMYAGRIVESAATDQIFARPLHPYTVGLLASIPQLDSGWGAPVPTIPGSAQDKGASGGCSFAPRCSLASTECRDTPPLRTVDGGRTVACWKVAR
jgi:oligopeptide/dipeptide ABC transporter ATP-binding protein